MKVKITIRIALCGLFIAANTSVAMDEDNSAAVLALSERLKQQNSQQLSPRNNSNNSSDTTLSLSLQTTPNTSPRAEFIIPPLNLTESGSPKLSPRILAAQASPKLSPRAFAELQEITAISDLDWQKPTPPSSSLTSPSRSPRDTIAAQFQITACFTNTPDRSIPCFTYVNSKQTIDGLDELTYRDKEDNVKTILFMTNKEYNNEQYLTIFETIQGVVQKYVIDLGNKTSSDTEQKKPKLSGVLTSNFYGMTNSITVYQGNITRINHENMNCEITYKDANDNTLAIDVDYTTTSKTPTYALIKEDNVFKFAIKLPEPKNITSQKSTAPKKINFPRTRKDSMSSVKTAIGVTFLTVCIILAYKYNKLPAAFEKLFDGIVAQCNNLIPSRFTR